MVDYSVENYKEDLKLCNAMIKRYFFKYQKEIEDLRQIGLVAQFRGRECYRKAQKTKLNTYLWSCTYLAMFDYLKRNNFKSERLNVVSLVVIFLVEKIALNVIRQTINSYVK